MSTRPAAARPLVPPDAAPALARILPFAAFIALLAFEPVLERVADARWIAIGRGLAAGALLLWLWPRYVELREAPLARHAALGIVTGLGVFLAWIAFDSGWAVLGGGGDGFVPVDRDGRLEGTMVALRLLGLVLVVPIMEELFWRSFVMRWIQRKDFLALDPRATGAVAFALSSALFAMEHAQWFAGLVAGAAYGWLYVRSRNLWIPILSHATTNALLGTWILATRNWQLW